MPRWICWRCWPGGETPAHLLVLGTYRPVEAIVHHHPLRTVVQDLQRHGSATELPLALLSAAAVSAYLAGRFPQQQLPTALASWLHQRTDGHPLFLVTLVQALVERGVLHEHDGCWIMQGRIEDIAVEVPESLRQLLEQHITRLPLEAQRVLEMASVAGVEFVAAVVAAGLETDANTVEEHCEALVERQLLQPLGVTTWPNGTVTACYAFVHALYQQVVYGRLGAGRRVRLHQRLGACLEAAYGAQAGEIAAKLAEHFVRGQDTRRAVPYLRQAGDNALARSAYHEAVACYEHALEGIAQLPESHDTRAQTIDLRLALRNVLWTLGDLERLFVTLQEAAGLAEALGDNHRLGWVSVYLLAHFAQVGDPERALAAGQRALTHGDDPGGAGPHGGGAALPGRGLPQPGGLSSGGRVLPNERGVSRRRAPPGAPRLARTGRGVCPQPSRHRACGVWGLRRGAGACRGGGPDGRGGQTPL